MTNMLNKISDELLNNVSGGVCTENDLTDSDSSEVIIEENTSDAPTVEKEIVPKFGHARYRF